MRALSRFQTDKEAKEVLDGLADGTVDLVIGTHRLLQPGVKIKNLGLVIVDEEQRFGVEHKEALKHLRAAVDVLSMSATPIPRTLEMAVTGIRELSTIATPPEERHPVLSFVGAYDEGQITAAIRRELLREGQVFYIHNRVQSIEKAAARLRELVPEARIATAHGQMAEHQLEQVMLDFWEKRFDVLVCTTIVESGLDVSNANTMIIERADMLGLSQLHQLRGRVGRGSERAYAYFLYPPDKPLTETAHDRLATIALHNELGGGMHVAMKDLEIRGAGNLLGGEQSGHIADVGFDLYVRLVGEAVSEFKGDETASPARAGRDGRTARSRRTCRSTTCPASGCGWRCTSTWRRSARSRTSTRCVPKWSTATANRPTWSRRCSTSLGCGSGCARPASARSRRPARTSGLPGWTSPNPPSCGSSASTTALYKRRHRAWPSSRTRRRPQSGAPDRRPRPASSGCAPSSTPWSADGRIGSPRAHPRAEPADPGRADDGCGVGRGARGAVRWSPPAMDRTWKRSATPGST